MTAGVGPEDVVWTALSAALAGRGRQAGRFQTLNCPMCQRRGETADRRGRCGVTYDAQGIGVNCFNCGFKSRYRLGEPLSQPMQQFMQALGLGRQAVQHLALSAMAIMRRVSPPDDKAPVAAWTQDFPTTALPDGARPLGDWLDAGCADPDFLDVAAYLLRRGETIATATTYYWTPHRRHDLHRRLIIPCLYQRRVVGWTARAVSPAVTPRYHDQTPADFLFNAAALTAPERQIVILVEGVFDALALDAVGLLGASLNERQAQWIKAAGKQVIMLPDRDRAGSRLVDTALYHGFAVSFPRLICTGQQSWWDASLKDADDAVRRYGRLYTLRSVIASSTRSRMEVMLKRKMMV